MAFSLVQASENFSSASPLSVTFSATSAGNVILVAGFFDTSVTLSSVSDGGDAITDSGKGLVSTVLPGSGITINSFIKAFFSPNTGRTTVTATYSGNPVIAELAAWVVAGGTNVQFDKVAQANGTAATADSGATGTLSSATEFAIGYGVPDDHFTAAGTGWTLDQIPASLGTLQEHQIISSTASIDGTGASAGGAWSMWAATIMSAGVVPPSESGGHIFRVYGQGWRWRAPPKGYKRRNGILLKAA